ncbi:MAG: FAD-binding monooxygenase [Proteobacteria bacterium]|jgi:2-polyprenyl-6-methoxyphenol hydroxylase-like FAD-dependent oxidoreductase|nr:FAD-binding monooxygenase [Pseudomonadota bacterium]
MQYHLNGYNSGDPNLSRDSDSGWFPSELPEHVDVLIIGCGPAGLTLAAQLAAFPEIKTCIVEAKSGPLQIGQADGIACRSVEMFEAFGFAEKVLKEAYWVNETTFWKPLKGQITDIVRSEKIQDTEDGLSEYPHVILNQARVHDFYLNLMRQSPRRLVPYYDRKLIDFTIDRAESFPVRARLQHLNPKYQHQDETINARYVVGCDGARSAVRTSLGKGLHGDSANQAWGVMDILAITDFPDIRLKSVIQSGNEGNLLIIPREGGYMTRLYIEMDKLSADERVSGRNITSHQLVEAAQRILHPYTLDVKEIAWWSVYEIGQRLCDSFDDVPEGKLVNPCVFIAGDACHTHSPKAGQGMNVSMADTFNLGWKLASVISGQCRPELLHTYSAERHAVATELIDFDREFSTMFSAPPRSEIDPDGVDPDDFKKYFIQHGRFTAGTAVQYLPSAIIGQPTHQHLAMGFEIGMRFHSAPVICLADAKPIQLGHVIKADGRWRLIIFSGKSGVNELCKFLTEDKSSPVLKFTPSGADIDSVIDVRAVFSDRHRDLDIMRMPSLLRPTKGRHGLVDYEKVFCSDIKVNADIFDLRKINRSHGCAVVVRPDQYVAQVLTLTDFEELAAFFDCFMKPQN